MNNCISGAALDPMVDDQRSKAYFERLCTFKATRFAFKPISPLMCSRYGWICVQKDLLKCGDCNHYLSVTLPPPSNLDCYRSCCDKLMTDVISAHSEFCVWRSQPTSLKHCVPVLQPKSLVINQFTKRLDQLRKVVITADVPRVNVAKLDDAGLVQNDIDLVQTWLRRQPCSSDDDDESRSGAIGSEQGLDTELAPHCLLISLALLGWTAMGTRHMVVCEYCLRQLWLPLFHKEHHILPDELPKPSPIKKLRYEVKKERVLNPASQHQPWCPWIEEIPISEWPMALELYQRKALEETNGSVAEPDGSTQPTVATDAKGLSDSDKAPRWRVALNVMDFESSTSGSETIAISSNNSEATVSDTFIHAKQLLHDSTDDHMELLEHDTDSISNGATGVPLVKHSYSVDDPLMRQISGSLDYTPRSPPTSPPPVSLSSRSISVSGTGQMAASGSEEREGTPPRGAVCLDLD